MLKRTGQVAALGLLGVRFAHGQERAEVRHGRGGLVTGHVAGAAVGEQVLADGGNAVDAAVTAALVACVTTPWNCGVGGFGGVLTLARAGGRKVTTIDFNTIAPAAATADLFPLDARGEVKGRVNFHGWRAAGVPGTLAGLQLALGRYGTRAFREVAQPAIALARDGVVVSEGWVRAIRSALPNFRQDAGSARTYLRDGEPPKVGEKLPNPDLAALLETLARENSVESFYRGTVARRIAQAFRANGGLVTADDLAAYRAREVEPLRLSCGDYTICTAPLTAGGLTSLEALAILQALAWDKLPATPEREHASVEALRWAWRDRLERLGDPDFVKVPVAELLSSEYARRAAAQVRAAVRAQKPLDLTVPRETDEGTVNLSAVDRHGNLVALTITQGSTFGAQVTVDGLGLTLGHGMSRFNPKPGHPNAPGPRKRPLHNMGPTAVLRRGQPVCALGGAGGLLIPSSLFGVLRGAVVQGRSWPEAVAAPRLHTTGTTELTVRGDWPAADVAYLGEVGFKVKTGGSAFLSAVWFDPQTGECGKVAR